MPAFIRFLDQYDCGHVRSLVAMSALSNLLLLAPSIHMLQVYDRVLNSGSAATLLYITLITLAILAAYGVIEAMRGRIAQRLAASYTVEVALKLFDNLARPPAGVTPGQFLRDYGQVRSFIGGRSFTALFDVPFIPLYVVLLFMAHWAIGFLSISGIVLMLAISYFNTVVTKESRRAAQKAEEEAAGFAQAAVAREDDLRAFGLMPSFMNIWKARTLAALHASEQGAADTAQFYALARSARQMLQVGLMALAALLVINGQMSGGLIFFCSMISGKAFGPIEQITGGWDQIANAYAAYHRVEGLIAGSEEPVAQSHLPPANGHLRADNILFRLDGMAHPLLNYASLDAEPGQLVLITGASAAGKSVLMQILSGGIRPVEGTVSLDGAEQSLWPSDQWATSVGYAPQDVTLFPGTLALNIARFDQQMDMQAVYDAARRVGAHDMIMALPEGYNTRTGDKSLALSVSQRHKVAMARAFYRMPPVLLLDQPGAPLDPPGEAQIMKAIVDAKARGTTIILTSNKAALAALADKAFVLRNGKLDALELVTHASPSRQPAEPASAEARAG